MKVFNPEKELRKIQKGNKNKIIISVIALLLIIAIGSSYALYQIRYKQIIYTTVEPFYRKNIQLAVYVENEKKESFPENNGTEYFYSHIACEEEGITTATWDYEQNVLSVVTKGPNKCNVYFVGKIVDFVYNGTDGTDGSIQEYIIPKTGNYKLEVWGAQGAPNEVGGMGGYSVGEVELNQGDILYIGVGGQGESGNTLGSVNNPKIYKGGFNGGGTGGSESSPYSWQYGNGGGGATHIAKVDGLLSSLKNNIDQILIIAGGGGGSSLFAENIFGGSGGGIQGNNGTNSLIHDNGTMFYAGTGATQIEGGHSILTNPFDDLGNGSFGQGGQYSRDIEIMDTIVAGAGGGGGLYGGGGSARGHAGAGGGSGYIGNELLKNKAMYCYQCTTTSEDPDTKTYSIEDYSSDAVSNYAKKGNGYARITYIGE